jgi:hypothetical protein
LDGGGVFDRFVGQIAGAAGHPALAALIAEVAAIGEVLKGASADDRLAASYPFLTMMSVATCGWLMERQLAALDGWTGDPQFAAMKRAAIRFYLDQIVPEAQGLAHAARAGADQLYAVPAGAFAA